MLRPTEPRWSGPHSFFRHTLEINSSRHQGHLSTPSFWSLLILRLYSSDSWREGAHPAQRHVSLGTALVKAVWLRVSRPRPTADRGAAFTRAEPLSHVREVPGGTGDVSLSTQTPASAKRQPHLKSWPGFLLETLASEADEPLAP